MPKLALNFICKDEAHVIDRMLNSCKSITDLITFTRAAKVASQLFETCNMSWIATLLILENRESSAATAINL